MIKRLHPSRVLPAIKRRLNERKFLKYWDNSAKGKQEKEYLTSIKNKYKDERLFLIANGPSIKDMDLSILKNEYTMCMNRFYIYFDKIGFTPNFLVCVEDTVLDQFTNDFNELKIEHKFINWRQFKKIPNSNYLKESYTFNPFFQTDLTKPTHFGGTVTFACLQLAYYLGFKEVIIIGMDHNFKETGRAATVEVRTYEKDESHFDPNYFPKGMKWVLPDLDKSEVGYNIANDFYNDKNRKIYDATVNGKCDIFEKKQFESFFL
jgi:hypothetical protein